MALLLGREEIPVPTPADRVSTWKNDSKSCRNVYPPLSRTSIAVNPIVPAWWRTPDLPLPTSLWMSNPLARRPQYPSRIFQFRSRIPRIRADTSARGREIQPNDTEAHQDISYICPTHLLETSIISVNGSNDISWPCYTHTKSPHPPHL
jgi:hypothetical protein